MGAVQSYFSSWLKTLQRLESSESPNISLRRSRQLLMSSSSDINPKWISTTQAWIWTLVSFSIMRVNCHRATRKLPSNKTSDWIHTLFACSTPVQEFESWPFLLHAINKYKKKQIYLFSTIVKWLNLVQKNNSSFDIIHIL